MNGVHYFIALLIRSEDHCLNRIYGTWCFDVPLSGLSLRVGAGLPPPDRRDEYASTGGKKTDSLGPSGNNLIRLSKT